MQGDPCIVRSPKPTLSGQYIEKSGFSSQGWQMERDEEHFDLDEDFVAGAEEDDYDRFIDRVDRRKQAVKKGKAAWSKLEDVLAEKRLQKELKDSYEDL
jgi:hypothetical protein